MIRRRDTEMSRRERTVGVMLAAVFIAVGTASAAMFAKLTFWPEGPIGDMQGMVVIGGTIMLLPGCAGLLAGATLMCLGTRRCSVLASRIGLAVMGVAATCLILMAASALSESAANARATQYTALADAELQRLAQEKHDPVARSELARRATVAKVERYRKMTAEQVLRLWKENGDAVARDEFLQRQTMYEAWQWKYQKMSDEELRRHLEEDSDSSAWFELGRRGKLSGAKDDLKSPGPTEP